MLSPRAYPSSLLAMTLILIAGCNQVESGSRPASVQALEARGLTVMQEFEVDGGMRGFAAIAGDNPVAIYVTPSGKAIIGTRLDDKGEPLDEVTLKDLVAKPTGERAWSQLDSAAWVLDGKVDAPRIVYSFSDPNCIYCNRFWQAARPWVDSGKVQLRHVIVGIIKDDSATKAAAILEAPDRSAALRENERKMSQGGITPAASVSASSRSILDANQVLMLSLGFRGTPGIVVRADDGAIKKYNGMPQRNALTEVLGPL